MCNREIKFCCRDRINKREEKSVYKGECVFLCTCVRARRREKFFFNFHTQRSQNEGRLELTTPHLCMANASFLLRFACLNNGQLFHYVI